MLSRGALQGKVTAAQPTSSGRRRIRLGYVVLAVLVPVTMLCGIVLGPVNVDPRDALAIIGQHLGLAGDGSWGRSDEVIVWEVRLPRALVGAVAGAALAMAGVVLQALVRNPLADPYVLGLSAGASTGAAAVVLWGVGGLIGSGGIPAAAFVGALTSALMVVLLARTSGPASSARLLMAGVTVGYVLNGATSMIVFSSDSAEGARSLMFWMLGSLVRADWATVPLVTVPVLAVGTLMYLVGHRVDGLTLGDPAARSLGLAPDRLRLLLLVATSLGVGAVVAFTGGIGFVGLVVPHVARRLAGTAEHRVVLPIAAGLGAVFLVWSDIAARLLLAPRELPLSVITVIVGGPFLAYLVRRTQHEIS